MPRSSVDVNGSASDGRRDQHQRSDAPAAYRCGRWPTGTDGRRLTAIAEQLAVDLRSDLRRRPADTAGRRQRRGHRPADRLLDRHAQRAAGHRDYPAARDPGAGKLSAVRLRTRREAAPLRQALPRYADDPGSKRFPARPPLSWAAVTWLRRAYTTKETEPEETFTLAESFALPLLSQTLVVVRNPDEPPRRRQVQLFSLAQPLARPGRGAEPIAGALPLLNTLGAAGYSREHTTAALVWLYFGPRV